MTEVNVSLVRQVEVATSLRGARGPAGGIPVLAADPGMPADGDVYYNSVSGAVRYYQDGVGWRQLLGQGENAVSASVWETARTILLGGDAAGSVELDGSQNVTLTVTVAALADKANTADLGTAAYVAVTAFDSAGSAAAAQAAAQAHADAEDDTHSAADRAYADGQASAAQAAAEATAQAALDAHTATLGTAATTDAGDYATAAQGALADSAPQPGHTHTEADISDLGSYPDATGQPATKMAQTDGADGWTFVDPPSGGSGYAPDPSAQPDGKWLTTESGAYVFTDPPVGGSGGAVSGLLLEEVSSGALSGPTATIPLPAGYEGFKLVIYSRSTDADGTADRMAARFTVGGVEQSGASDYSWQAGGPGITGTDDYAHSYLALGLTTNAGADEYGYAEITIDPRYDDAGYYTTVLNTSIAAANDAAWNSLGGGSYRQKAVVDGIVLAFEHQGWGNTSFEGDSEYVLYGYAPAVAVGGGTTTVGSLVLAQTVEQVTNPIVAVSGAVAWDSAATTLGDFTGRDITLTLSGYGYLEGLVEAGYYTTRIQYSTDSGNTWTDVVGPVFKGTEAIDAKSAVFRVPVDAPNVLWSGTPTGEVLVQVGLQSSAGDNTEKLYGVNLSALVFEDVSVGSSVSTSSVSIGPGEWQTATLLNGWAAHSVGYPSARYRKDSFGTVHLGGLITGGSTVTTTDIFVLPEGYRPDKDIIVPVAESDGSTENQGNLSIRATGEVEIRPGSGNNFYSLEGISFLSADAAPITVGGGTSVSIPTFTATHAAGIGTLRWYNDTGASITIAGARATISADAVDAATVVDVNVDDTTALDAPISIAVGTRTTKVTDEIVVPADSYLTVDVDSVGTPGAGETLSVQFYM